MKLMSSLVIAVAFSLYVIGYVDGRTRQSQAPTAIYQLPQ